jgi:hypothetical protein
VSELINAWLIEATFPSTPLFVSPESLRMVLKRIYDDWRIKRDRVEKTAAALAQLNHYCYGNSVMEDNHLDNLQIIYNVAGVLKENGFRVAGTSIQEYIKLGRWNQKHAQALAMNIARVIVDFWEDQAHAGELDAATQERRKRLMSRPIEDRAQPPVSV